MYFGGNHRWVPLRLANKVLDVRVIETVAAETILNYFNWVSNFRKTKLRWLNTVFAVCKYMSFAKSWQEKGSAHILKLGK